MSLQDITITGSIKSLVTQSYGQRTYIASTEEQSFPIETITGSYAGAWPNFKPRSLTSTNSASNTTVDLIVNVTQSWTGSNLSISGSIPYIHYTMDEFVNGEFSGSTYTVTDGSLIDAQCEQFLTVNTTPTNYSVFPYSVYRVNGVIQGNSQFGVFINQLTAPPNGGILLFKEDDDKQITFPPPIGTITINYKKIIYLKISRYDQEGNNNTLSLQELTNIRWTDSIAGLIDLEVLNITEYPTYYLYAVKSKTWVNTIYVPGDDNVLNYSLSASFTGTSASAGLYYLDQWNVINSSGGTFNTYYYTFTNPSPNYSLNYTASITAYNGNASPVTFDFSFVENTYVGSTPYFNVIDQTQSVSIPSLQSRTFTLKGLSDAQFIGNPSIQYHLETNNLTAPISLSNTFWIVTHSSFPQSFTSSVVIEPYLLSNFANSDCDVLINNYSENDYSKSYREVLYDNGGIIPSNLQQIISGTAQFAEVNDYLYNANANILPRYKGVRTTSPNINLPSTNGFTNEELSNIPFSSNLNIDNGTSNVTNLQTYFAYFDYLQDTTAELIGKSAAHILYLVDKDGNIQTPTLTGSYYWNLIDNFETDKFASNVIVEGEEGNKLFLGNKRIIRPGVIPRAILYSQTGSGYNIQSPLRFSDVISSGSISNFTSKYSTETPYQDISYGVTSTIKATTTNLSSTNVTLNPGNGVFTINTTANNTILKFIFNGVFFMSNPTYLAPYNNYYTTLYFQKSTDGGSTWFNIASTQYWSNNYDGTSTRYGNWTPPVDIIPTSGDKYRFQLYNPSGYYIIRFYPDTSIVVSQNPPGTNVTASITAGNYWSTSSVSSSIIYSTQFDPLYTPGYPLTQNNMNGSGYNKPLPFEIQPYDQIRFEGDENQSYTILEVNPDSVPNEGFNTDFSTWYNNDPIDLVLNPNKTITYSDNGGINLNNLSQSFDISLIDGATYTFYVTLSNYTDGLFVIYFSGFGWPPSPFFFPSPPAPFVGPLTISQSVTYNAANAAFANDENQVTFEFLTASPGGGFTVDYIGYALDTNTTKDKLFLKLDRGITPGTDINSFLIRRLYPHPNYVLLDTPAISGSGYLLPQYVTNDLKQNFDKAITSLRERSLI